MKFPLFSLFATLVLTSSAFAARGVFPPTLLDEAGSKVEVTSVFETVPPTGYAPIRVKLVNNSTAVQSATIRNTSRTSSSYDSGHELESVFSVTAQPGTTVEREFLAPLCTEVDSSSYGGSGELRITVQAGGRSSAHTVSSGGQAALQFAAFSEALAGKSIGDINKAGQDLHPSKWSYGNESFATLYSPALLPSEWRGYAGLDALAITSDEWFALQPGVKTAILHWVRLGGVLDVFSKKGSPGLEQLGIKAGAEVASRHGGQARALGNGLVCPVEWNGSELTGAIAGSYSVTNTSPARQAECTDALADERIANSAGSMRATDSPLVKALGEKSFAAWQVGLILFVFGIMVGPVNLFYFARTGRRHRLFYTTPVISVAAAVLLLLVIFFQDGVGGTGHRASVVYLDAAENAAFIHQVQVSRTGVLFGGSFTTDEPAAVSMAVMPASRWTRLKSRESSHSYGRSDRGEGQRYSTSDKSYGGDWFQSRTEQAQIIDAVQSTRGRIELKPGGGAPVISSSLTSPLERLFYVDSQEKYWASSGALTTGAAVTLTPVSGEAFQAWREEAVSMLPAPLRSKLTLKPQKDFFYAASSEAGAGMVATLDSINWKSDRVFIYGPLR
ncbi:MAG TPA: hypothetical protein VG796_11585 [Verrucomicrobiales bacterium]|jgi:hypothetical protein|nr:hypothetical protein [Verrucomicrobiales bacterium]